MEQHAIFTRREAFTKGGMLGAASFFLAADGAAAQPRQGSAKTLVAYFSRTGNTRLIARQVRRAVVADLFEIEPADPYPEDYSETVAQSKKEQDAGFEPPLKATVPNIASYQTVFLGFPVWGTSAPAVIKSFLSRHDVAGRTLVPLITHGGYGLGQSLRVIAAAAPRARLARGLSMQAEQEREVLAKVTGWLGKLRIDR